MKTSKKNARRDLKGCPQRSGICLKEFTTTPRKPCSANRRVARVRLSTYKTIIAFVPGKTKGRAPKEKGKRKGKGKPISQGVLPLNPYDKVMVHGCGATDIPGMRYRLIRNMRTACKSLPLRRHARSKYGTKSHVVKMYRLVDPKF
jgi:small subunit ribosomal protein S12